MFNLIFRILFAGLGCFLVFWLPTFVDANAQFGLAFGVISLYLALNSLFYFFYGVKIRGGGTLNVLMNIFLPIVYMGINFGLAFAAVLLFYKQGLRYDVAMVFWLGSFVVILLSGAMLGLASKIPVCLYLPGDILNKEKPDWRGKESRLFPPQSFWSTFLMYTYLFDPNLALVMLSLCVVSCAPYIYRVISAALQLISHALRRDEQDILKNVAKYDPEIVIYCSGARGAVYQLNQWIPVLEQCDKRVLILVRERHYLSGMVDTTLPVAYARTMSVIDLFMTASTRVVLYPANSAKNTHMMRWNEMTHVFINHGESDKVVNVSNFVRCYDVLYLAGKMAADRLNEANLGISEERLTFVGLPQTDLSLIVAEARVNKTVITVLYAPTWEGFSDAACYTSISEYSFQAFYELLKDKNIRVLYKPHPYTGSVNKNLAASLKKINKMFTDAKNAVVFGAEKNIHELMDESDLLVTDVSSVLNDYLYTEKPIVISNPNMLSDDRYHELFYSSRAAYILDDKMTDLVTVINQISDEDSMRGERLKVKEYSLGIWPQGSLNRFNERLAYDYLQEKAS